ncbi:ferredoxin [Xinfangfangia sp. D13-10-4-6]|nr:ferredoxin [Pseudogemmobacter hezensis]
MHDLEARLAPHFLTVLGGFNPDPGEAGIWKFAQTLVLIGPKEPGYWPHLTAQKEWDGRPDPVDRWSRRVIGRLACQIGGKALFPFGGPPFHPFYAWALRSGQVWDSPVRLLVHAGQGLMVSFRGALALRERFEIAPATRPCDSCAAPCLRACPAGVLGRAGYDVPGCHAFLDQPAGADCLNAGCITRRACPLSAGYARLPEHSGYHMSQFHK